MKSARQPCGCRYEVSERERWIELCPKHRAEAEDTHARWSADHARPARAQQEHTRRPQ